MLIVAEASRVREQYNNINSSGSIAGYENNIIILIVAEASRNPDDNIIILIVAGASRVPSGRLLLNVVALLSRAPVELVDGLAGHLLTHLLTSHLSDSLPSTEQNREQ